MKRVLLVAGCVALFVLGIFGIAFAHAEIDHCTPGVGSTVTSAPSEIVCVMTEEIDPKQSTMSVTDASGAQVDKKDAHVDLNDADRKTLVVSLDTSMVKDGVYTVKWHTVTPDDNGVTDGTFQFTVGNAAATPQPTTMVVQEGTPSAATDEHADDQAAHYCTDKGGTVTTRYPTYGTNLPQDQWLRLGSAREFCTFLAPPDESGFQSHIEIALDTLYSDQPSLAVLAYLEPVSLPPFTGANPSTLYCNKLGGSDIWGGMNNAAGGGWVTEAPDSATNFQVVGMCVFPDMSAIDSWGLTYKANTVVRGTDLGKVVRYQPTELPNVFISGSSTNAPATGAIDKMLTKADNGSKVSLKLGDSLSIELESNPSTGYSWQVSGADQSVLAAAGEPQFNLPSGATARPGAPGTQTFVFNAVGKGTTTLSLIYVRPWEKDVTPTPPNTFSVQVTVE